MAGVLSIFFSTVFQRTSTSLLFWLFLLAQVDAQNRSHEVQTLLRFKSTVDVDIGSVTQGYWGTWNGKDPNPCAWWGVICTDNSTVLELDFSNLQLTRIPTLGVLSDLPDLRQLNLSNNNFRSNGPVGVALPVIIPDDIGSLVGLTHLDIGFNNFGGPIPGNITACRNLRYLSVQFNYLTGEIPDLSALVKLQFLYGRRNLFAGSFPKWLGQLNDLLEVELSFNPLAGIVPSISNLTKLVSVRMYNCSFTGFEEPIFPNATRLDNFNFAYNQLQGSIPLGITKFANLEYLSLSNNNLSGSIPSGFSLNVSKAATVDFSQNQLTGNIPESLLQSTTRAINLPNLILSNNYLTGLIPLDGTKQYNYNKIDLSNNNLSGTIPSICSNGTSYVNYFWIYNNNLQGDIVDFLAGCYDYVTNLNLANNSLSGDLSRLATVNTSSLDAADQSDRALNLNNGYRDLSNNNLHISSTQANSDPLRGLLEFFVLNTSIVEFHMQGNNFSGTTLPSNFPTPASVLQVLDLSNNDLAGEISGTAFNSTWLPALQTLDLSSNDITGPIPQAILLLPNLQFLNLTNNSLSGPLPTIVPNSLDNPNNFAGNSGLCGGPLRACSRGTGVPWWVLLSVIGGAMVIALGSCLLAGWQWKVYSRRHECDAELLRTLMDRDTATLMPLRELKKATNNFAKSSQVGEGAFGAVYAGTLFNGTRVAIKRSKRMESDKDKEQFLNEVRILSQVNHRNLVKLLGCCMENNVALLVFEFVPNGTLQQYLRADIVDGVTKRLSWKQRLAIAIQTADALNYLHSAATFPIYHRDVKSANILLTDDFNAKVADFGVSRLATREATHVSTIAVQGTMGYIDPEYHNTFQLTSKSDVYSFGVVLLELISAKAPIDTSRDEDETGLVSFAYPLMVSGDLKRFVDPYLLETYSDPAGKQSILNVGRLAVQCVDRRSRARPNMNEVRIDLQNFWLELEGYELVDAVEEKQKKISQGDIVESKSFLESHDSAGNSGSDVMEMSLLSVPSKVRVM